MKKKIIIIGVFILFIAFSTNIYATGFLQNVFGQASNFVKVNDLNAAITNPNNNTVGGALSQVLTGSSIDVIGTIMNIGNVVIFVVTIALGIKYIYSGIDGKADIKSSLPNYVFGVVFFYLAQAVFDLSRGAIFGALEGGTSYDTFAGNIYSTVNTMANTCAILGIILVGLKYMLSPADTKADVKKQLVPVTLGIVLVYCTLKVIMFVYNIGQGLLS